MRNWVRFAEMSLTTIKQLISGKMRSKSYNLDETDRRALRFACDRSSRWVSHGLGVSKSHSVRCFTIADQLKVVAIAKHVRERRHCRHDLLLGHLKHADRHINILLAPQEVDRGVQMLFARPFSDDLARVLVDAEG